MSEEATSGATGVWGRREEIAPFPPVAGIEMRVVAGERLMAVWVRIEPNTVMPMHHHEHEQIGVLLEGELAMTIGDETRVLHSGDSYVIPPDVEHGAETHAAGCLVLDMFAPVRADYLALAHAAAEHAAASSGQ